MIFIYIVMKYKDIHIDIGNDYNIYTNDITNIGDTNFDLTKDELITDLLYPNKFDICDYVDLFYNVYFTYSDFRKIFEQLLYNRKSYLNSELLHNLIIFSEEYTDDKEINEAISKYGYYNIISQVIIKLFYIPFGQYYSFENINKNNITSIFTEKILNKYRDYLIELYRINDPEEDITDINIVDLFILILKETVPKIIFNDKLYKIISD